MKTKIKFKRILHSWVALHPQPKGVIQFIGGTFFGSFFPMFFYQHILKFLFDQGYSIILLPFKFTLNHYNQAGFLINEQYEILPEIVRIAKIENYAYEVYLDEQNFYWLGHSIGCKYIILLEVFTALPHTPEARKIFITKILSESLKPRSKKQIEKIILEVEYLIKSLKQKVILAKQLIKNYVNKDISLGDSRINEQTSLENSIGWLFIKGQTSIFLAPDNSDIDNIIKIKFLSNVINRLGIRVSPTPDETNNLALNSNLFNKLALVSFESDSTAEKTVQWFDETLQKPLKKYRSQHKGGHLRPLGIDVFNQVINFFDFFYAWLLYIARIDSQQPRNLTPIMQSQQERNLELENIIRTYEDTLFV